jgi:hypothetical protein
VLIVEKTVKFHSRLTRADLFTVEIAIPNEDPHEDTRLGNDPSLGSFSSIFHFQVELNANRGDSNGTKKNVRNQMYRVW